MANQKGVSKGAIRFRTNLRRLIHDAGWTREKAAKRIGISSNRLRKLCNDGIAKVSPSNKGDVEKIRQTFGLPRSDFLWSAKPCSTRNAPKYSEAELHEKINLVVAIWQIDAHDRNLRRLYRNIERTLEVALQKASQKGEVIAEWEQTPRSRRKGMTVDADYWSGENEDEDASEAIVESLPPKLEATLDDCHFDIAGEIAR